MPSPSFAAVGQRVTAWTSNLLASAVVLLLALGVGRQLVAWYRVESPLVKPSAADRPPLAGLADGEPIELNFGDAPFGVQRREFSGDPTAARAALVAACRGLAAPLPLAQPSAAENSLLELCRRETPAITTADGRQIYAPPTALPLVVVLRSIAARNALPELAAGENRVVAWGMASSAGPGEWHLYVAHFERSRQAADFAAPAAFGAGGSDVATNELPLPPGARRLLALGDRHGGSLASFAGNGQAPEWMAFFAGWFGRRQWTRKEDWRFTGGFWRARYEQPGEAERTTVDLQIGPDGAAGLVGFATIERQSHGDSAQGDSASGEPAPVGGNP